MTFRFFRVMRDLDVRIVVKVGADTRQHFEDKLALYLQTIIESARKRKIKPIHTVLDALFEEDTLD